ncbi:MAB_1171c family putative transporter [Williamsia sterculiae]|uniref:DUF6545 domain-containing protein n=1 Tax=Williamsia sterculiae TaxID=1344003 RepID=A0A1N7H981_9NOCA|nr:MAB_1171c family putative transporter [Williamsia sterculiae]SIS21434.1 hypothetical protein SAMN05445060_3750 [Williamsia sterculiae]
MVVAGAVTSGALVGIVNVVAVVLFAVALCWRLERLRRGEGGLQSWAMTVAIAALTISFVVTSRSVSAWVDTNLFAGLARIAYYCLLSIGVAALVITFFFFRDSTDETQRRKIGAEAVPLVVAVIGLNVAMFATPVSIRSSNISEFTTRDLGFALFFVISGCYLVYGLFASVNSIRRYLLLADGYLRISLALTFCGLIVMALGTVVQTAFVIGSFTSWWTLPVFVPAATTLEIIGLAIFFLGLCFPMLHSMRVAARDRVRDRRRMRELTPLWELLTADFPALVLPDFRGNQSAQLRRRVVEIRDALVRISPYLPADFDDLSPQVQLGALDIALHQHRAATAGPGAARPVLAAEGPGIEGDAAPLLRLSRVVAERRARGENPVDGSDTGRHRAASDPSTSATASAGPSAARRPSGSSRR